MLLQFTTSPKTCTKCLTEYSTPVGNFSRSKKNKDGFGFWCKSCQKVYRQTNKERIKAHKAAAFQAIKNDPVKYTDRLKKSREWKREHRNHDTDSAYRAAHREERNAYNRRWRAMNPEKAKAGGKRYYYRKNNLPAGFTDADWEYTLDYWKDRCCTCGNAGAHGQRLHTDHWIPVSYKGKDNPGTVAWNIVPLCKKCNSTKHSKMPMDFLRRMYPEKQARKVAQEVQLFLNSVRTQTEQKAA